MKLRLHERIDCKICVKKSTDIVGFTLIFPVQKRFIF